MSIKGNAPPAVIRSTPSTHTLPSSGDTLESKRKDQVTKRTKAQADSTFLVALT
jgi:hypothetical protein